MSAPGAGDILTIVKERLDGSVATSYPGTVTATPPGWVVVRAAWGRPRIDLGYLVFEPDDVFIEYFALESAVNAFALHDAAGRLKGWYCNVAQNRLEGETLAWRDLILDLIVYPDGRQLVLDEDELVESGLESAEPALYDAVWEALAELRRAAEAGAYPFSESPMEPQA